MYGKYECFVMQMLYVCVLCASCDRSQCCVLHDLQFVDAVLIKDARSDHMEETPNDTAYKWCSCHSGHKLLCNLCCTQQWGPDLLFLGMPAMRTRWMTGAADYKSG